MSFLTHYDANPYVELVRAPDGKTTVTFRLQTQDATLAQALLSMLVDWLKVNRAAWYPEANGVELKDETQKVE